MPRTIKEWKGKTDDAMPPPRVRALFNYCADDGKFFWRARSRDQFKTDKDWKRWNNRYAGRPAGYDCNGYIKIKIDNKRYYAHRLAWAYVYGVWPKKNIDHINGIKNDNSINNLRDVSPSENSRNTKIGKKNKTGVIGVSFGRSGSYVASIFHQDKQVFLGTFPKLSEAKKARKKAEAKYGYHQNHGRS